MTGRIVVFGATGYTGRLTAEALVARGAQPVLAGRSREKLLELSTSLGGLDTAVADISSAESVGRLVGAGDVLVTCVGPFTTWGTPAVEAVIAAGATYLDSTGEGGFIRRVFQEWGPKAEQSGATLLTAFGYDYIPGNLAGALALDRAGEAARRVDVGYFITGKAGMSGGTLATTFATATETTCTFRDGEIVEAGPAKWVRSFTYDGDSHDALSVGASEHFALPRLAPQLREVNVYLGWFGPLTKTMHVAAAVGHAAVKVPGVETALKAFLKAVPKIAPGDGPDAESRARSGSRVIGIAYDDAGQPLSEVHLAGVNGYDFTANILAWGAMAAADGRSKGSGALGPAEAYGLDELRAGVEGAGLLVATVP